MTLMLLTGLAIGQLASLSPIQSRPSEGRSADVTTTATRYYSALNELFASGDPSAVRAMLHPRFTDHSSEDGAVRSSQQFEEVITDMARTSPGLHLEASIDVAQDNVVGAQLTYDGPAESTPGDIALGFDTSFTKFELLHFEDGKVIERWADSAMISAGHVEVPASLVVQAPGRNLDIYFHRIALEPSTRLHFKNETGAVVFVESGRLELVVDPDVNDRGDQAWISHALSPGDARAIRSGASFLTAAAGSQPVTVLAATFDGLDYTVSRFLDTTDANVEPGATSDLLSSGPGLGTTAGTFEVALSVIDLAPGTSVARHSVQESEIALVINGEVEVEIDQGTVHQSGSQSAAGHGPLDLVADDAISAAGGVVLGYHTGDVSSARIMLITVSPAEAQI